jgi:hypothetical protein
MTRRGLVSMLPAGLVAAACGYHVGGKADLIPAKVRTIAIPAFGNNTTRYKLTELLPGAITREFLSRTRYRIVADPNEADAILAGTVVNYFASPSIMDQATGRAAGLVVILLLNITLTDKGTGTVLFQRTNYEFRGRYEVSSDQVQYFDESGTSMQRLSQEVARQVVSSILEAF